MLILFNSWFAASLSKDGAMTVFIQQPETPVTAAPLTGLSRVTPRSPHEALGMAVSYLMVDPSFARLSFGHWARVLTGQINRGHYLFVANGKRIVGFAGWALTTADKAEAWLAGRELAFGDSMAGPSMVINAWKAETPEAQRFIVDTMRTMHVTGEAVYFKRVYKDGRVRPMRLNVNDQVALHLAAAGR
jgi:hemolysin-activating ACP:hemolysin acyltransferase